MAILINGRPQKFSSVGGNTPNPISYIFFASSGESSVTVEIKNSVGNIIAIIQQSFVNTVAEVDISSILKAQLSQTLDQTNNTQGLQFFEYYVNADSANRRYAVLANEQNLVGDLTPNTLFNTSVENALFLNQIKERQFVQGIKDALQILVDENTSSLTGIRVVYEFFDSNQNQISTFLIQYSKGLNFRLSFDLLDNGAITVPDNCAFFEVYLEEGILISAFALLATGSTYDDFELLATGSTYDAENILVTPQPY